MSCSGRLQTVVASETTTDRPSAGSADGPGTLLSWLQGDLSANAVVDPASRTLAAEDHSVQVHACHGAARQVEVLREVLLGLLADDPTLEPRDIMVMCPDIESYAPLISAAFGMGDIGRHPGHELRVRLADRSLTQTNPLLAVVGQLLDLAGGRAEASRVLDLLSAEPVRRRFGFTDSDLETITGWVESAGIRWAFDADHREPFGLAGYVQNTWRFGLDRVLAGVAVSDDADRFFGTTLPLDDVGSTSIDLAGRLGECLDRLQRVTDDLTGSHPVGHWLTTVGEGIEALTSVARGDEWQTAQVHRELASTVDATAGSGLELRLPDVRALMRERLAGRPTRANFRTGTLTVATLVPMRSVPHRVVCLLGLDDGVFPRAGAIDGDDVLARRPFTGERDPRSEDRQLMLDAITAATEHLVVTYTGANETTGQQAPTRRTPRRAPRLPRRDRDRRQGARAAPPPAAGLRPGEPRGLGTVLVRCRGTRRRPGCCSAADRARVARRARAPPTRRRRRARRPGLLLQAPGQGVLAQAARDRPRRRGGRGLRRPARRARRPGAVGRG